MVGAAHAHRLDAPRPRGGHGDDVGDHGVQPAARGDRRRAQGLPDGRPHLGVDRGRLRPDVDDARDGALHRRWRRDHAHRHRPRAWRSSPSTPTSGRRPPPTRRSCRARRGGHPLGHAAQQHVPAGHPRRPHRRPAGGRRRPGDARLPERQPRRGRVRRAVHLRHPARPEPAPRLRAGHPLLRRRQPGPARAAPAVRRAHPAVDATCGSSPPPDIEPNIFAGAVRRFDLAFELR